MKLSTLIDSIRSDRTLDRADAGKSKCEAIEDLITKFGWEPIKQNRLAILEDDDPSLSNWQTAAEVFWDAVLETTDLSRLTG